MFLFYFISLFIILFGFVAYPLISKKYIGKIGYRKFIPIFLGFSVVGSVIISLVVYRTFSFDFFYLPLLAGLGAMYTSATYLLFYSIERYNLSVINTILGIQDILIVLFSGIFFFIAEVKIILLPFFIVMLGIIFLVFGSTGKSKFSKYVLLALAAVILWVFMWIIFYTINTSFPLIYYSVLQLFSFVFCIPIAFIQNRSKGIQYYTTDKKFFYIGIAGILNGSATVAFSFAYKFNALLTPFVAQLAIPLVIIFSVLLLRERPQKLEIIGLSLLTFASFLYIFHSYLFIV